MCVKSKRTLTPSQWWDVSRWKCRDRMPGKVNLFLFYSFRVIIENRNCATGILGGRDWLTDEVARVLLEVIRFSSAKTKVGVVEARKGCWWACPSKPNLEDDEAILLRTSIEVGWLLRLSWKAEIRKSHKKDFVKKQTVKDNFWVIILKSFWGLQHIKLISFLVSVIFL